MFTTAFNSYVSTELTALICTNLTGSNLILVGWSLTDSYMRSYKHDRCEAEKCDFLWPETKDAQSKVAALKAVNSTLSKEQVC